MRFVILIATFFTFAMANAQIASSFPTEKDKYLKALDDFMKANKLEKCITSVDAFEATVKKGAFNDAQMQKIIETSNVMLSRTMSPFPYFYHYLSAITAYANNQGDPAKFISFSDIAMNVAKNKAKGDNKEYLKFMEFSDALFSQGAINVTNSKTWKVDTKDYTINDKDGKLKISFPSTRLASMTNRDSMEIFNTKGDFYPLENKWVGQGGNLYWTKAGVDKKIASAVIKKPYEISLDNFLFSIDSVEFLHTEFFKAPLVGKYTDKLGLGDSANTTYPRFDSKDLGVFIKNLAPNVDYSGGFNFYGSRVIGYGTSDQKASVTFYKNDMVTKILTAYFTEFPIKKDDELTSQKAQILLFNGKDTIFHPELTMIYKIKTRELRLLRSESAISRSKFIDTYHNYEFDADAIFWNLDSTRMILKTLGGVGKVGSEFESNGYFEKEKVRKLQGISNYEPLSVIRMMYEKTGSRVLDANALAKAMNPNLTEGMAKSLYYQLVEEGFIVYDEPSSTVLMRDKVLHYVLSNAKRKDYDIIKMRSIPKDGQDYIDLSNNNIELKGVKSIPISDTASVYFFPDNNFVKIQKNRNLEFDGLIYGGRMDFYGKDQKFQYDSFLVNLSGLDSMRINIPDGDKTDVNGTPKLMTLRTNIEGIKGQMKIDLPINKSGRARLLQYPQLISKENSFAYYDDPAIQRGVYDRKSFYFKLDPFRLDSLNTFTPSAINWKGKMYTGGIFPEFNESLRVQKDLSLGFTTMSPKGFDTYKGGGKYTGDITLDMRGLTGVGELDYLTSKTKSHDFIFFIDSTKATSDTFVIAKTSDGVKTPDVASSGNPILWKPKVDSMIIYMKDQPFSMYEQQTAFKGNLILTSKGLKGGGVLDWTEALVSSKDFNFKTDNLNADTAALNIKSTFGDKVTFNTPNVKAFIDFKNKVADFKSNLPDNPTEFAYNQYKTNIKEFKWDIEKKILVFSVPAGAAAEYFESTRTAQMGLKFLSKRAVYDLQSATLRCEQVPNIYIADAQVIPDSGVVVIEGEAVMRTLKNATIFADTLTKKHKIENCTLDILSKAQLKGNGAFKYSCEGHPNQKIDLNDITCQKEVVGLKKNQTTDYSLVAKGEIAQSKNFFLYPTVNYFGDATVFGRNPDLFFKGFGKINFKNKDIPTSEFSMVDDINPDKFLIHYDSLIKASDGAKLGLGLYFDKSSDMVTPYTTFFSRKNNANDPVMLQPVGAIDFNPTKGEYRFGTEEIIKGESKIGSLMTLDENKNVVTGEGQMGFGVDFGLIRTTAYGTFQEDKAKNQFTFNTTLGIDIRVENKAIEEKLENYIYVDNLDLNDINYETDKFRQVLLNITNPKDDEKMIKAYETTGNFSRPKSLDHYLVFTDVNFVYDPVDFTFRSYGKLGLSFLGGREIHKRVEGYIEIGPRQGMDYFNIYLKTGAGEWFYFEYKPGILGLLSSYDEFIRTIGAVASDKRKIKDDKGRFYAYTIGSSIAKDQFVEAMKEKVNPTMGKEVPYFKQKPNAPAKIDSTKTKSKPTENVVPENGSKSKEEAAPVSPKTEVPKVETPVKVEPKKEEVAPAKEPAKTETPQRVEPKPSNTEAQPAIEEDAAPTDTKPKKEKKPKKSKAEVIEEN